MSTRKNLTSEYPRIHVKQAWALLCSGETLPVNKTVSDKLGLTIDRPELCRYWEDESGNCAIIFTIFEGFRMEMYLAFPDNEYEVEVWSTNVDKDGAMKWELI